MSQSQTYLESKSHYAILDGLRGVAAIMVVIFHVLETYTGGNRFVQIINHGYLAVDFFFVLSGFVVSYAYDDRWSKMTTWDFFKRRLVRLHPMIIMGSVIGAALFYFQDCEAFPLIAGTPVWKMLLVMLIGMTLIPLPVSMDIRGWQEMHPLNGPAWTLFFEYVANILYVLLIRRFSKTLLTICVLLSAWLLVHYLVLGPRGDVIGGWSLEEEQFSIGYTRLLYPFLAGMLLSRMGKLITVKGGFWVCSLAIIVVLSVPRIGGGEHLWMNGLYEAFCIIVIFPLIVSIGAGSSLGGSNYSAKICKFLGGISYPIYITHYPLIYCYMAWALNNKIPMRYGLPVGLLLVVIAILISYACLKLYDEPVREWLKKRFLIRKKNKIPEETVV